MAEYGVYADVARIKGLLGITDTTDDAELYLQLVAASRDIDRHCHRPFYIVTATRYPHERDPDRKRRLWCDDLLSATTIEIDEDGDGTYETTMAVTDYLLWPWDRWPKRAIEIDMRQGDVGGWPAESIQQSVQLAGTWGYGDGNRASPWDASGATGTVATATGTTLTVSSVAPFAVGQNILLGTEQMHVTAVTAGPPATLTVVRGINGTTAAIQNAADASIAAYPSDVTMACVVMASRSWKRKDSAWTNQYGNPAFGTVQVYKGLDPDAERLLGPYVRWDH